MGPRPALVHRHEAQAVCQRPRRGGPEKPVFRDPFRFRRCLVPATGFLEWKHEGKKKHPYFVRPRDRDVFVYAGLWDRWTRWRC